MNGDIPTLEALTERVLNAPFEGRRRLVALAGTPASGKSTLAAALAGALVQEGAKAQVVPMDGFHLDNLLLVPSGLLARKGAPQTFDAAGFIHLVQRLAVEDDVVYPLFDRASDRAIAGAGVVNGDCDTVIVEGNYLLFDADPWRQLAASWDLSILLAPPMQVLRERLVARWLAHGLTKDAAIARAEENDLANAATILAAALPADITLGGVTI
ncbi:MAG: nucleoside/nucleotide kinase family protein [Sulfitobacter sp.]